VEVAAAAGGKCGGGEAKGEKEGEEPDRRHEEIRPLEFADR
jgi:hypothetical protein